MSEIIRTQGTVHSQIYMEIKSFKSSAKPILILGYIIWDKDKFGF